jgi:hypothetical protein
MDKYSSVVVFAAIVGIMMATLSTTITSMPIASALVTGPPVHVGNPTHLSTGPPVPNCTAIFQGNFHGPPDDTRLGCK